MKFNYNIFCNLPAHIISVKELPESAKRLRFTSNEIRKAGIKKVRRVEAVYMHNRALVDELTDRYELHEFKAKPAYIANALSFLRMYEQLLKDYPTDEFFLCCEDDLVCGSDKKTFEYYLNNIPNDWDVLHLGAIVTKQVSEFNKKLTISSVDWCNVEHRPHSVKEWDASAWLTLTLPKKLYQPWNGIVGGYCNVYRRGALLTFIKNAKDIFLEGGGDIAHLTACQKFGMRLTCINKPFKVFSNSDFFDFNLRRVRAADVVDNTDNNLICRPCGEAFVRVGLMFQANFRSLCTKYEIKPEDDPFLIAHKRN